MNCPVSTRRINFRSSFDLVAQVRLAEGRWGAWRGSRGPSVTGLVPRRLSASPSRPCHFRAWVMTDRLQTRGEIPHGYGIPTARPFRAEGECPFVRLLGHVRSPDRRWPRSRLHRCGRRGRSQLLRQRRGVFGGESETIMGKAFQSSDGSGTLRRLHEDLLGS